MFDIFGSGEKSFIGWITPGSDFLIFDSHDNGTVNNINDMFGGMSRGEGFLKLAKLDANNDGFIDKSDPDFYKLKVWIDKNEDGVVSSDELFTLTELGIESLCVDYDIIDEVDSNGNMKGERSYAVINGVQHEMSDIYFKYY